MNIIDILSKRYSVKEFDKNKMIPQNKLDTLIKGMSLTPSSYGLEPYRLVIVENREIRKKLVEHSYNQNQVVDSSHLVVICREKNINEEFVNRYIKNISRIRQKNLEDLQTHKNVLLSFVNNSTEEKIKNWATQQAFIVLGNLLTICAIEGVDACPMGGFTPQKYDEILGLNSMGLQSLVLAAIGYRSSSDKYQYLAKVRRPIDDIIVNL